MRKINENPRHPSQELIASANTWIVFSIQICVGHVQQRRPAAPAGGIAIATRSSTSGRARCGFVSRPRCRRRAVRHRAPSSIPLWTSGLLWLRRCGSGLDLLRRTAPTAARRVQPPTSCWCRWRRRTCICRPRSQLPPIFLTSIYHSERAADEPAGQPGAAVCRYMPIAYNSRASSLRIVAKPSKRPNGFRRAQIHFGPTERRFELSLAFS